MFVTETIKYVGVNDCKIDLFEGQFIVPHGISYNSYVILDEKIAVMDSVDAAFSREWLDNIEKVLRENGAEKPDYLVVQHMEPDHSASIINFAEAYPEARIVASCKAFWMMKNYFGTDYIDRQVVVCQEGTLTLGRHHLTFFMAPMVHWPEVMVTYDSTEGVLFSADAFGRFGAVENAAAYESKIQCASTIQVPAAGQEPAEGVGATVGQTARLSAKEWADEARRYYIGIVGKYGAQVQNLLKKLSVLDVRIICPLHGPVLKERIKDYVTLYETWSAYEPEQEGILIAYTSVYGNTKRAVLKLAEMLKGRGCSKVVVRDLARCDMSTVVSEAFCYSKLVLATTTYNGDVFPFMREFIHQLTERNFSNRKVAFIENGSWAPLATNVMKRMLEKSRDLSYAEMNVRIMSALNEDSMAQLEILAEELLI